MVATVGDGAVTRVGGLLLAAGGGRRFGGPKAVVRLAGERLVDRGVRTLMDGGCAPVVVVLGASTEPVPGAVVVVNPAWREGMSASLGVGLRAFGGEVPEVGPVDAVVVALVDQPGVGAAVIGRLLAAHRSGVSLAVATYHGDRRNPVLFGRAHWPGVLESLAGDAGARRYVEAWGNAVVEVECGDIGDPFDIDTPEDLRHFTGG